jgi:hypothetical protein
MTGEPQQQHIDLGNFIGEVAERKNFEDQNKGKALLNSDDEYVFKLIKFPRGIPKKEERINADKSVTTINKIMSVCEFEERDSKNIVVTLFRVDKLNYGDDEKFRSGVVKFFQKIGSPLPENKYPNWKEHFIPGMRFRGRVVVKTEKDKDDNTVMKYYLDVPTVRKLQPGDKAGEDFAHDAPVAKPDASLANALLLVKGAKDFNSAMDMLKAAGASKEVTMALFQANYDGKVTFPIQ